eukprot:Tbor_TRINITY_DN4239_c0_g1::TRINITY_DN4239_c0_g1_i1::g.23945::m.23945
MSGCTDYFIPIPFRTDGGGIKVPDYSLLQQYLNTRSPTIASSDSVITAIQQLTEKRREIVSVCTKAGDVVNRRGSETVKTSKTDISTEVTSSFVNGTISEYLQLLFYAQAHMPLSDVDAPAPLSKLCYTWTVQGVPKRSKSQGGSVEEITGVNNSMYEVCSVLINAAACHSLIAQDEIEKSGEGGEGIKEAFKNLQIAWGILEKVSEISPIGLLNQRHGDALTAATGDSNLNSNKPLLAISDLSEGGLKLFKSILAANAHHCGLIKIEMSMKDKYDLLSRSAMEAYELYTEAGALAKAAATNRHFDTSATTGVPYEISCAFAAGIMKAKANYYLGVKSHLVDDDIGEALGRYRSALVMIEWCEQMNNDVVTKEKMWLQAVKGMIVQENAQLTQENNTIYMRPIKRDLDDPDRSGKALGKPIECSLYGGSTSSVNNSTQGASSSSSSHATGQHLKKIHDPFFGVVPFHILSIINDHSAKVRNIVKQCRESVTNHKSRTKSLIHALGVTAVIDASQAETTSNASPKLPTVISDKIIALRQQAEGQFESLNSSAKSNTRKTRTPITQHSVGSLGDTITNSLVYCKDLRYSIIGQLQDIKTELEKEAILDSMKRKQYGSAVWDAKRKPASTLPEGLAIQRAIAEFSGSIDKWLTTPMDRAKKAFMQNLQDNMNANDALEQGGKLSFADRIDLSLLDWPLDELDKLMPLNRSQYGSRSKEIEKINKLIKSLRGNLERIDELYDEIQIKLNDIWAVVDSDNIAFQLSSAAKDKHTQIIVEAQKDLNTTITNEITSRLCTVDKISIQVEEDVSALAIHQSSDPFADEVRELSRSLEKTISLYETISQDTQSALLFAANIFEQVSDTLDSTKSFVTCRKLEAEEISIKLDHELAEKIRIIEDRESAIRESRAKQEAIEARIRELEGNHVRPGYDGSHNHPPIPRDNTNVMPGQQYGQNPPMSMGGTVSQFPTLSHLPPPDQYGSYSSGSHGVPPYQYPPQHHQGPPAQQQYPTYY